MQVIAGFSAQPLNHWRGIFVISITFNVLDLMTNWKQCPMKMLRHTGRFLFTGGLAILCRMECHSMTLLQDNSRVIGSLSGKIGVAYETIAPYGPTVDIGRYYDPGSQSYFNGGSYSGAAVGMGFHGSYRITQNSPLGSDFGQPSTG